MTRTLDNDFALDIVRFPGDAVSICYGPAILHNVQDIIKPALQSAIYYPSNFVFVNFGSVQINFSCAAFNRLQNEFGAAQFCNRCHTQLTFADVTKGYFAVCPTCNENLYTFETYKKEQN